MAELNVEPNEVYKALSSRIGELEAENISLRLLLAEATRVIDAMHTAAGDKGTTV